MIEFLLVAFLIWASARGLVQQTRRDLARWKGGGGKSGKGGRPGSRAAFWGHQVLHGFPTARAGLADGWNRGREAHRRAQRSLAETRAGHAEGRAVHGPVMDRLRDRRRRALAELERQQWRRQELDRRDRHRRLWDELDDELGPEGPGEDKPDGPDKPDDRGSPDDEDAPDDKDTPGEDTPPDDKDPEDPGKDTPDKDAPGDAPVPGPGSEPVSADVTYESVRTRMQQDQADAEQRQAEAEQAMAGCEERVANAEEAKKFAETSAEEMQALEVDGETLSAMADHLSALDKAVQAENDLQEAATRAKEAWGEAGESASNVDQRLQSGHGPLQEAHDAAPGGGAEKPFYTEG